MSIKKFITTRLAKIFNAVEDRAYIFAIRWHAKLVRKVKILILGITMLRIRLQFAFPLPGDDESLDSDICGVVDLFFGVVPDAKEKNFSETIESLKGRNAEIYQWLQNDQVAKKDREMYFRALHLWSTTINDAKRAESIAAAYKSIHQKKLKPIDLSALSKERSVLRKRIRSEERALRESKAQRIKIPAKQIAFLISAMPVVVSVSCYMHASIFYGHFGIDVSQFFSMKDYLVTSIYSMKQAVFGILGCTLGLLHAYRNMNTRTKHERERKERVAKFTDWWIYAHLAALLYAGYRYNISVFWMTFPVAAFAFTALPIGSFARRYFQKPDTISFGMMIAVMITSSFFSAAHLRILDVKDARNENAFLIETTVQHFTNEHHVFLGGSERYIFLLNKNGGTEIIPQGEIKKMSMFGSASP